MPFKSKAHQAAVMIRLRRELSRGIRKLRADRNSTMGRIVLDPTTGNVIVGGDDFYASHEQLANDAFPPNRKRTKAKRLIAGVIWPDAGIEEESLYAFSRVRGRYSDARWTGTNATYTNKQLVGALNLYLARQRRKKKK